MLLGGGLAKRFVLSQTSDHPAKQQRDQFEAKGRMTWQPRPIFPREGERETLNNCAGLLFLLMGQRYARQVSIWPQVRAMKKSNRNSCLFKEKKKEKNIFTFVHRARRGITGLPSKRAGKFPTLSPRCVCSAFFERPVSGFRRKKAQWESCAGTSSCTVTRHTLVNYLLLQRFK